METISFKIREKDFLVTISNIFHGTLQIYVAHPLGVHLRA